MTDFERYLLFAAASVIGLLGGVYQAMREHWDKFRIPRRAVFTASLGGFLCAIGTTSIILHLYQWEKPWLILAGAVIAGVGAPKLLAMGVRWVERRADERAKDD